MNKRGSHVGIVLSFIIFIIFLMFLYSVLQPKIRIEREKQTTLNNLKEEFIEEISENLTIISILDKTAGHTSYDCLKIDESAAGIAGLYSIVRDEENNIVDSSSSGGFLEISWTDQEFFKIYSSPEEFNEYSFSGITCSEAQAKSATKNKYIFRTKIYPFKKNYSNNYNDLKSKLGVPAADEFGFNFEHSNGTIIGTAEEGISANIYSERMSIQYIDKDANIKNGFIDLKVW